MNDSPHPPPERLFGPLDAVSPDAEVGFDGRFYRYRAYRYERRSDAVDYARLDRAREGSAPTSDDSTWQASTPTVPEPGLLESLAVTYDGRDYRYGVYRYDRWEDAVAYARLKGQNGGRHPFP